MCPSLLKCSQLEKLCINRGSIRFPDTRFSHIQTFWNLIPHFNLLISRLPNIVEKSFVLQTKLWIPPFQLIMSQLSSMFVAREIKQKLWRIFFWTPCNICRLSWGCLDCIDGMSKICMGWIDISEGQSRNCQVSTGHFWSGYVGTGQVRTCSVMTNQTGR